MSIQKSNGALRRLSHKEDKPSWVESSTDGIICIIHIRMNVMRLIYLKDVLAIREEERCTFRKLIITETSGEKSSLLLFYSSDPKFKKLKKRFAGGFDFNYSSQLS